MYLSPNRDLEALGIADVVRPVADASIQVFDVERCHPECAPCDSQGLPGVLPNVKRESTTTNILTVNSFISD